MSITSHTKQSLELELGATKADLAKVAAQRDRSERALLDLEAANKRTEATIDSVLHHGLRRLLWLARNNELEAALAQCGHGQEELTDLAELLLRETDPCEAEHLVRVTMRLDE